MVVCKEKGGRRRRGLRLSPMSKGLSVVRPMNFNFEPQSYASLRSICFVLPDEIEGDLQKLKFIIY